MIDTHKTLSCPRVTPFSLIASPIPQSRFPNSGLYQPSTSNKLSELNSRPSHQYSQPTAFFTMAAHGHEVPEWLHQFFTQVKLEDIAHAMRNITLADFTHLINIAKGQKLNATTVTKLYEEASKVSGAGTALFTVALVIAVIAFCFPMAAAALFLTPLGFTMNNIAAASIASTSQSIWGVNALFSLLQSAAMGGYGAPVVAAVVQGASAVSAGFSALKLWSMGNWTMPWKL
ncbi:hypothetical protein KCU95_g14719, partial [Aureobasidium melanogenum]